MKRFAIAAAAAAAVGVSAPAYAAPTFNFDGTSGTFEYKTVRPFPNFSNIYNFTLATAGELSGTISSSASSVASDLDFTTVRIDGPGLGATGLNFAVGSTGVVEFRSLLPTLVQAGSYTLTVAGTTGRNASYSGTLAFAAAGVPEPATWGLMILGFGMVGSAMRRRAAKTTVRFA